MINMCSEIGKPGDILERLDLISDPSVFHARVRDSEDIQVMRCRKTGVIYLSRFSGHKYEEFAGGEYWGTTSVKDAIVSCGEDDERRFKQFQGCLRRSNICDVGGGAGGFLMRCASISKNLTLIEPGHQSSDFLQSCFRDKDIDFKSFQTTKDWLQSRSESDSRFDVVTYFHVFEHLEDPLDELKRAYELLKENGRIIIEVPHANDWLIHNCPAFRDFTFWSQHLILHTRESLWTFAVEAGFKDINITGFQRYPLCNHLHWLAKGKPGGHIKWCHMSSNDVNSSYAAQLASLNMTDTLILTATRPLAKKSMN